MALTAPDYERETVAWFFRPAKRTGPLWTKRETAFQRTDPLASGSVCSHRVVCLHDTVPSATYLKIEQIAPSTLPPIGSELC